MKTREMSMGEKQAIVKLREDEKSIKPLHNIGNSQCNHLECPEERNHWCTKWHTSNG